MLCLLFLILTVGSLVNCQAVNNYDLIINNNYVVLYNSTVGSGTLKYSCSGDKHSVPLSPFQKVKLKCENADLETILYNGAVLKLKEQTMGSINLYWSTPHYEGFMLGSPNLYYNSFFINYDLDSFYTFVDNDGKPHFQENIPRNIQYFLTDVLCSNNIALIVNSTVYSTNRKTELRINGFNIL